MKCLFDFKFNVFFPLIIRANQENSKGLSEKYLGGF